MVINNVTFCENSRRNVCARHEVPRFGAALRVFGKQGSRRPPGGFWISDYNVVGARFIAPTVGNHLLGNFFEVIRKRVTELFFKKLWFNSDPAWHLVLESAARRFRHIPAGSLFSDRAYWGAVWRQIKLLNYWN